MYIICIPTNILLFSMATLLYISEEDKKMKSLDYIKEKIKMLER